MYWEIRYAAFKRSFYTSSACRSPGTGFDVDRASSCTVFFYLRELQKWNRRINLISNADDIVVIQQHFLDSLSCALAAVIQPSCRLLDIGSGAGFPGIPLKIYYPALHVTAVDAVTKKVMFLRQLCRSLALEHVECVSVRLEPDLHSSGAFPSAAFDVIVSRAVGTVPLLLSLAAPLLCPAGYVLLQRGKEGYQEFEAHASLFSEYGLQPVDIREISFSFLTYPRYLLVLRRK